MTPESRNSLLLGNGSVNTFPRKRTRNSRRAVFSVVRAALAAAQLCSSESTRNNTGSSVFCGGRRKAI
jgi:hypothetical protein